MILQFSAMCFNVLLHIGAVWNIVSCVQATRQYLLPYSELSAGAVIWWNTTFERI